MGLKSGCQGWEIVRQEEIDLYCPIRREGGQLQGIRG